MTSTCIIDSPPIKLVPYKVYSAILFNHNVDFVKIFSTPS